MARPFPDRSLWQLVAFVLLRIPVTIGWACLVAAVAGTLLFAAALCAVPLAAVLGGQLLRAALRPLRHPLRLLRHPIRTLGSVTRPRTGEPGWLDRAAQRLRRRRALLALGAVAAWRYAAERERLAVARGSGTAIPAPYRPARGEDAQGRLRGSAADPATWKDAAYVLVAPLVALTAGAALLALWVAAANLLTVGIREGVFPPPGPSRVWNAVLGLVLVVGGLLVVLATPLVVRALAALHVAVAGALLAPAREVRLQMELREQRERRELAVQAAEAERRRIERDLHDGAQQRLVALAMNLGMARRKFAEDPAAAESLVAEAHAEAKQALVELRDLARGIHTSVLTDRGLDAALSALTRRVGVPVEVSVDLPQRLPVAVESAAYFVVAEAMTNVTRHAEASAAAVTMLAREGALLVTVQDDGRGGADPARGTGLAGLADRLAAVDGSMHIDSPVGGPTCVQVEIPCGS